MSTPNWQSDFEELDWSRHLATEMHFRGATDEHVKDALATAEAHCRDSGQPPEVAMGDPVETATDLVGRRTAPLTHALRENLPLALSVAGWLIVINLLGRPMTDRVHPTWFTLPLLLALWLLTPITEALLMRLFPRTSANGLGCAASLAVVAVVLSAAHYLDGVDTPRVDLPVWSGWAVAGACLTGWLVLWLRRRRRKDAEARRLTIQKEPR
ncbi:hypothetical protein [Luteococcus sediminum]